jgi:hypothetical protein
MHDSSPKHQDDALRDWRCELCSGTNLEIETTMLGGVVHIVCRDCGATETLDPRTKK